MRRLLALRRPGPDTLDRLGEVAMALVPGVLVVYLSFNAGGFFPNTVSYVVVILAALIALRALVVRHPLEGVTRGSLLAGVGLAVLAGWVVASVSWSDAPTRALIEFDRVGLYLLVFILFAGAAQTSARLEWMLRGIVVAIAVVCIVGLITRVLPDVWPIAPNLANNRLSYPLTYWNALGVLASVGIVLSFHLACAGDVSRPERVIGAGLVPLLAVTLFFTFSRGAIAVTAVGLVAYVAIARPSALWGGVVATVPTAALAVAVAYDADLLASLRPTTDAAVAQGHDVAAAAAFSAIGAASLRGLLLPVDDRGFGLTLSTRARNRVLTVGAIVFIIGALAVNLPGEASEQYDRFTSGRPVQSSGDLRQRLTDPGNNGRLAHWQVALDGFEAAPLKGQGAGTFELLWDKERPREWAEIQVLDAHSLYAEVLGELGIVGFLALIVPLGAIVFALARGVRGLDRPLFGAFLAAVIVWLLHAGVDWDWENPAVSAWLFGVGAVALAAPGPRPIRLAGFPVRLTVFVACVAVAVPATLVAASQLKIIEAERAWNRNDCTTALAAARSARDWLSLRPEPHQVIGYCQARRGQTALGIEAIQTAIDYDPRNWKLRYGLAIMRGLAGMDPRAASAAALRMNPLEPVTREAARRFRTGNPLRWRREARRLLRGVVL